MLLQCGIDGIILLLVGGPEFLSRAYMDGDVHFAVGIERAVNSHLSGLLPIVNLAIEVRVVSAQRGDQDRHRTIADDFTEAAFGFKHASGGPAQHHGVILPAFDPAADLAQTDARRHDGPRV